MWRGGPECWLVTGEGGGEAADLESLEGRVKSGDALSAAVGGRRGGGESRALGNSDTGWEGASQDQTCRKAGSGEGLGVGAPCGYHSPLSPLG